MRQLFVILITIFAYPLHAQEAIVRTGDHPTFTRIVLSMPAGTNWNVERVNDGYKLQVDNDVSLNTELFFERIRRNRVGEIRQGESASELFINLACACFAEAFQWRSDQLVIDIKDPGSPKSADAIFIPNAQVAMDLPAPPLPAAPAEILPDLELPLNFSETTTASANPMLPTGTLTAIVEEQARVGTLERAVTDSLQRALSQGLLQAGDRNPTPIDPIDSNDQLADLLAGVQSALTPGIIARTSVDRELRQNAPQNLRDDGIACVPDALVDIPNWANEIPFSKRVGDLRTQITGEFDRIDGTAVQELAKTYLTFGFGREAINTLKIDGAKSQARQIIQTLGEIIDDEPVSLDNFSLQVGCPGHVALWGFLAHKDGPLPAKPDVNGIVVSFKLLPKALRQHIAPRLATKLSRLGHQDLATDVLSIGDTDKTDVVVAETEILLDNGENADAVRELSALAEDDPRITPATLEKLIKLKLAANEPIDANELTLLRTFQFETQDQATLRSLYATEVEVLIAMESYEAAEDLIESRESDFDSETRAALRTQLFKKFATNSTDADFLRVAFDDDRQVNDPENQNAFASRLLELGFPERSRHFLKGQAIGENMMARRYLRAQAAFDLGEMDIGRAELAGMTTPRAEELLAQAASITTLESPFNLTANNQTDTAEDPLFRAISERIQENTSFEPDTETPLTDGRALAEGASDLRNEMVELLERFQINE